MPHERDARQARIELDDAALNIEARKDRSKRRGSRQLGVSGEQHEGGNES
jgi:hypothetical protein